MGVSPKLIVEVVADVSQFVKSMSTSSKAATVFQADLKAVSVDARAAANAQVAAAVKTTDALHAEVAAYHEIAAAAAAGSKEQIAAARLGASAQRRLDGALVGAAGSARKAHGETDHLGRSLEHAGRGAISGTGALQGFSRSLAFASGGFIAFEGVSRFLTDSINAAREAGVAQRSLAAQMKTSGESFDANRERIDKVALSYGKFGFQNDEVIQSLTVLERGTGSINKAIAVQGLTADIARAKNIGLASAATVVAKVFGGQETALRRAVPGLAKSAHGWDLIRLAQAKMAGQAAAGTTVSERFAATLHNTEEIVGTGLLPILNKYLTSLSQWLDKMNRSGQLQKDVASAAQTLTSAFDAAKDAANLVIGAFKTLNSVTGSTKNTLKLLFSAFLAFKTLKLASTLAGIATSLRGIGTEAEASTGKVRGLRGALKSLPELVAITASIDIIMSAHTTETGLHRYSGLKGWSNLFHDLGHPQRLFENLTGGGKAQPKPVVLKPFPDIGFRAADLSDPTKDIKQFKATAAQRNAWFDAIINRQLSRVSGAPIEAQLGMLQRISAAITRRIAITKDITRKLNLEDQLYAIAQQEKQVRADRQQAFFDRLQLNIDRTTLTKTLNDDLAALAVQQRSIEKAIRIQGHTLALDQALLANQQAHAAKVQEQADAAKASREAAKAAREAAQAETLAWADFAEERAAATPGLKDDLATAKAKLAILKEQAGAGKKTAEEARAIWEQEQKVNEILKKPTGGTKFRPVNAENFIRSLGLNLTRQQAGRLTAGIAQLGPGGTMPVQRTQSFALAGGVTIQGDLHLHGVQDPKQLQNALTKHAKSQPHPRRGAR